MADGRYQVVMWGRHKKWPLFIGTETECEKFILRNCTDGIYRIIYEPDGKVYDIGQAVLYQVKKADGNWEKGIAQS